MTQMNGYKDVTSILDFVKIKICDEYCKYPEQYTFDGRTYESEEKFEELLAERCDQCPLNLL